MTLPSEFVALAPHSASGAGVGSHSQPLAIVQRNAPVLRGESPTMVLPSRLKANGVASYDSWPTRAYPEASVHKKGWCDDWLPTRWVKLPARIVPSSLIPIAPPVVNP